MDNTDGLNEQVTEDGITNVNGLGADDSVVELHKMASQMHQLMSQGTQVIKTSPGHAQKHFTASETVNLIVKNGSSHQRHNRQHNDGKVTSLGMPGKLSNGIADKNNNLTYIQR